MDAPSQAVQNDLRRPTLGRAWGGVSVRGANAHYKLMKTADIIAMPIAQLAEDNAHLYLWVTNNFLRDGLDVLKAWGFRYVTLITWAKDRMGIGQYFRGMTEHCIFAVRGSLPYRSTPEGKRMQGTTLISAKKGAHSVKPEEMRAMIERVSYPPYLELFSREPHVGWDVFGHEATAPIHIDDGTLFDSARMPEAE